MDFTNSENQLIAASTVAHDSATCWLGPDGRKCDMCWWAEHEQRQVRTALQQAVMDADDDMARLDRNSYDRLDQSAATIRSRRAALLERAAPDALTEGALALAEAWLCDEAWYRHLPDNAAQDAAVLELAGEIEGVIGSYLERHQCECDTN